MQESSSDNKKRVDTLLCGYNIKKSKCRGEIYEY